MRFSTWKVNNNSDRFDKKQILTKKKSEPETYNFLKTDKSFHKFIIFSIQASKHMKKKKVSDRNALSTSIFILAIRPFSFFLFSFFFAVRKP